MKSGKDSDADDNAAKLRDQDRFPQHWQVGYCTNVHPGVSLEQIQQNLQRHAVPIGNAVFRNDPMGIGLWLSETATRELSLEGRASQFADALNELGLCPFTINAFPFGDFHQPVVKHNVYQPDWANQKRLDYTCRVASIQAALLPNDMEGSISTLPLGWREVAGQKLAGIRKVSQKRSELTDLMPADDLQACVQNLRRLAEHLDRLLQDQGRLIRVCLEPEPGCWLDTYHDVIQLFEVVTNGLSADERQRVRRHLGVCHDICHSAVMFEPQQAALDAYRKHEIAIGKVQVSSAVEVNFESIADSTKTETLAALQRFCEPRYLHQTCCSDPASGEVSFFEDLPLAIESAQNKGANGRWRIHFHVPIFLKTFGLLQSTQSQIRECVNWCRLHSAKVSHFEIETYAWNVLPKELQPGSLNQGIGAEIEWFLKLSQATRL